MDEEVLVNDTLMQSLQEKFSSKPAKKPKENDIIENKEKKRAKELKVLDAKAAQNLSVIFGTKMHIVCHTFYDQVNAQVVL